MKRVDLLVSDLCEEIDSLREECERLAKERDHYQSEFHKAVNSSIRHGDKMMGIVLKAMLDKSEGLDGPPVDDFGFR